MKFKVARRKTEKCRDCGFCALICPSRDICIECGACVDACPNEARVLEEILGRRKEIKIKGYLFSSFQTKLIDEQFFEFVVDIFSL